MSVRSYTIPVAASTGVGIGRFHASNQKVLPIHEQYAFCAIRLGRKANGPDASNRMKDEIRKKYFTDTGKMVLVTYEADHQCG